MSDEKPAGVLKNTALVEMSMRITKASYNKTDPNAMRWSAIDSDTEDDLYQEKMSIELYRDFVSRIENHTPIPEPFAEAICEADWCGGMPYLSIAHYKAGTAKNNVPGEVESVYIDGTRLKSKGSLHNSDMGRTVWEKLREDLALKERSDVGHLPIRISIGFLDLEHKHRAVAGGPEFVFTRSNIGEICPLCAQGIGGKIYMKGQLIHLAMTRVPVNPRTEMLAEKSMDEITTKKQDAESIIGELANTLEEKSIATDVLVVRSDGDAPITDTQLCDECYDPNTALYDQDCVNRVMEKYVSGPREAANVKSMALVDVLAQYFSKAKKDVEEPMDTKKKSEEEAQEDKSVLGIPEKPFNFAGINGDGNNNLPSPVKSKDGDSDDSDGSEMEKSFATLKTLVGQAKAGKLNPEQYTEQINKAFAKLGQSVEDEFTPKSTTSTADLESVLRSVIEPLRAEIAVLRAQINKSGNDAVSNGVVRSKSLNLNGRVTPEQLIQRALPQQPERKLTKIQEIALRSTGAIK